MAKIAEIVVEKHLELDGVSYCEGDIIPYICWERHGQKNEMYDAKLWSIRNDNVIEILPHHHRDRGETPLLNTMFRKDSSLGYIYAIFIDNIVSNEEVERYEYRVSSAKSYYIRDGEVYARTPQEAEKRLAKTELSAYWNEETENWKNEVSVNIYHNGHRYLRDAKGKLIQ